MLRVQLVMWGHIRLFLQYCYRSNILEGVNNSGKQIQNFFYEWIQKYQTKRSGYYIIQDNSDTIIEKLECDHNVFVIIITQNFDYHLPSHKYVIGWVNVNAFS